MKQYLVFGIFLFLIRRNKTTAKEIAQNFEVSSRTVYRYIDALNLAGVPIVSESGKNGGIYIMPNFSIENLLLSKQEKDTILGAISTKKIPENVVEILSKICV